MAAFYFPRQKPQKTAKKRAETPSFSIL